MQGFLTRIIDRRLRRLTVGMTIGLAIVATAGAVTGGWADTKFDDAELAVAKAQLLLAGSPCGAAGEQNTASCEKLLRRAEELLAQARKAVTAAAREAVGGDVVLRPR